MVEIRKITQNIKMKLKIWQNLNLCQKKLKIIEEYKSGIGYELLAKKYNWSISAIWHIMPEEFKRKQIIDNSLWNNEKIIQDYIAGMTYKEISKKYRIGLTTLVKRIPKEILRGHKRK